MRCGFLLLLCLSACTKPAPSTPAPAAQPPPPAAEAAPPRTPDAPAPAPAPDVPAAPPDAERGTPGLSPADTDRLQSASFIDPGALETAFEAFLTEQGFNLIEKTHTDSIDGDDPVPEGEHPSIKTGYRIGPCSPVEAWWIFASYNGADWYPTPDSATLPWASDAADGEEQATVENPKKSKHDWTDQVEVWRAKDTGRVTLFGHYERGEGWGVTRLMERVDDTTWLLEDVIFAD